MMRFQIIFLTLLMLCTSCTLNIDETFVEGSDNKISNETKSEEETNVRANAKIPMKAI